MPQLDELKAEAAALRASAVASGRPVQHSAALEQVAKQHGYQSWRACRAALDAGDHTAVQAQPGFETRRYQSERWGFGIDVPLRWNAFPAVPTNSPYEIIRFASSEQGRHVLIIFREPCDPDISLDQHMARIQGHLQQAGFDNFALGECVIGTSTGRTLDFDKMLDNGLWSCRHYLIAAGTLCYVLGFGTTRRDAMLGLFDRTAASFVFEPVPWKQAD